MKAIIGLGNPGLKYKNTRHNIGYLVIDRFLKENNLNLKGSKLNGNFVKCQINNETLIIGKSNDFMNNSGYFVLQIKLFFKLKDEDILIISDDKDQQIGNFKIKNNGSSGGHNGLKDIIKNLSSTNFLRLKIGIGDLNKKNDTSKYVLDNFTKKEKDIIEKKMNLYLKIMNDFLVKDFFELANNYNGK